MNAHDALGETPALIEILHQTGLSIVTRKARLARRERQRKAATRELVRTVDGRGRPALRSVHRKSPASPHSDELLIEIEELQDEVEDRETLLDELTAWVSKNTGLPESLIRSMAFQQESLDRPEFLRAYASLSTLDGKDQKKQFWRRLILQNKVLVQFLGLAGNCKNEQQAAKSQGTRSGSKSFRVPKEKAIGALENVLKIRRKPRWSLRTLAKQTGRSTGWIQGQRAYQEYLAKRVVSASSKARKTVSLTDAVLANAGEDDGALKRLVEEGSSESARLRSQAMKECDDQRREMELAALIRDQGEEDEGNPLAHYSKLRAKIRKML